MNFLRIPLTLMLVFSVTQAADWKTWRGPNRDGLSEETGLMAKWPAEGPRKVWASSDAGLGYSSFAISGDVIYTMGADDSMEFLIALDANTGKKKSQVAIGERLQNNWGDGPRSTPTIAGNHVIAVGGQGDVACVSINDGTVRWKTSMIALGGEVPKWGYSESALVDGDKVLLTPGGPDGTVVAFDLKTGNKIWQSTEVTEQAHYSSIVAVDHFGQRQYIQLTQNKVFGLDTAGKLLWLAEWPLGRTAVIPTPVYHDGHVYITSGYGAGCMLLKVDKDNQVEKVYDNKTMKNHHGGVIRLGDHVYGFSDGRGWTCQDLLTGETTWYEKRKLGKGAIAYADGRFYCLDENTGTCTLIAADESGWEEHGRFTITPQTEQRSAKGKIWTHPVIANGDCTFAIKKSFAAMTFVCSWLTSAKSGIGILPANEFGQKTGSTPLPRLRRPSKQGINEKRHRTTIDSARNGVGGTLRLFADSQCQCRLSVCRRHRAVR